MRKANEVGEVEVVVDNGSLSHLFLALSLLMNVLYQAHIIADFIPRKMVILQETAIQDTPPLST